MDSYEYRGLPTDPEVLTDAGLRRECEAWNAEGRALNVKIDAYRRYIADIESNIRLGKPAPPPEPMSPSIPEQALAHLARRQPLAERVVAFCRGKRQALQKAAQERREQTLAGLQKLGFSPDHASAALRFDTQAWAIAGEVSRVDMASCNAHGNPGFDTRVSAQLVAAAKRLRLRELGIEQ